MHTDKPSLFGILLTSLVLVPVLAMAGLGYWSDYRQQLNQAMELAEAVARAGDERISGSLRTIDLLLQYVAEDVGNGTDVTAISKTLRLQVASTQEVDMLMVTDAQGQFLAGSSTPQRLADVSGFQFFTVQRLLAPARKIVIDGPLLHDDAPRIVVSRPILGQNGDFKGVAVAVLTPDFFTAPLRQMAPRRISSAILLNTNGVVLSRFPEAAQPGIEDMSDSAFMDDYRQTQGPGVAHIRDGHDGSILAWRPVAKYPLVLTVAIPGEQVRQAWIKAAGPKLAIEGGLLLMLAFTVGMVHQRGRNLARTAWELENLNSDLEKRVQKRTATLAAEVARRHEVEIQLREARDKAEAASEAKSRFLAVASHDLRQPVQALHLYANVLAEQPLAPDGADIVGCIRGSVSALAELMDSLLDISRLEAGIVHSSPRAMPLGRMLNQLWQDFQPLAEDRSVSLSVVTTDSWVHSDPALLGRILQNLISNAIRYTPSGGKVLVGCRHHGTSLEVQVLDTGIGIPENQRERIFQEFTQVDHPGNQPDRQGLGLGLAIVRRLCNLLAAPLTLTSEVGQGSLFALSLPKAEAGGRVPTAYPTPPLAHGARILVIDDEPNIRDSLRLQLSAWGYAPHSAATADEATALWQERRFEVIIADYGLGRGVSGIDLCKELLNRAQTSVPVIILSGDTSRERLQEPMPPSFRLLHKPVDPLVLRLALGGEEVQ